MQELALTRRAALTMGLGAATATVAGCGSLGDIRRHGVSTPAPSPTPSVAPQWVASDALSPALVEAIDLAAMNEAAGIWLGPATKDQYGPYRPLRLPTGHKLLHAKPTDPDKDALATRPMRDWRYQLSIIAPLFVREVLDPPELWVHNRKRQAAWTNRMWEVLSPGGKKDPSGYFGQESFMNSDGKLAQRVGGLPAKRTTAKARLGVEDLWWTVLPDADGMAWIQLQANTTSLVTVGSAPYTWTRTSRLAVAFTSKSTWMSPHRGRCLFDGDAQRLDQTSSAPTGHPSRGLGATHGEELHLLDTQGIHQVKARRQVRPPLGWPWQGHHRRVDESGGSSGSQLESGSRLPEHPDLPARRGWRAGRMGTRPRPESVHVQGMGVRPTTHRRSSVLDHPRDCRGRPAPPRVHMAPHRVIVPPPCPRLRRSARQPLLG